MVFPRHWMMPGLLLCVWALMGCAPIPHVAYSAPQLSGVIVDGGAPLADSEVYLSAGVGDDCEHYDLAAVTSDAGHFEIGPIKRLEFFVWLIGDPITHWNLCVGRADERRAILRQGGIGMSPDALTLHCDLSLETEIDIDAFGDIWGVCERVRR